MARSAPLSGLITKMPVSHFVISTFRSGCYDAVVRGTSAHLIGQHSRATKKNVFLDCFPSGGKNNKIEGGERDFSLSVRQGLLSGKHNCFVAPPLKAILLPRYHLALRSAFGGGAKAVSTAALALTGGECG